MPYGTKMGSLKTLKQSLAKGGSGAAWIKYIPKNGSMNVRFIEEPEQWVNYIEHFDTVLRRSFPCTGESDCPGCKGEARKTARYLANAVDVDQDRVIPLQLPKDLANRLVVRYERNGTLIDRDFELSRSGEGLDTVYDVDAGPATRKNLGKYTPLDLMKVLQDAYEEVFSADPDANGTPPTPAKPIKRSAAAKAVTPPVDEPEEDTDDEPAKPPKKSKAGKRAAKAVAPPEPTFLVDDEGAAAPQDEDDDEDGYSEDDLRALPLGALRAVAREFGVDPKGKDADDIVDEILASGEPVDDPDNPPF